MSESNWEYLYRTAPEGIKKIILRIPESDLNKMSMSEAQLHVKSFIYREREPPRNNPLEFTPAENMLKYNMFPDSMTAREPVYAYKQNEKMYNVLISKSDSTSKQALEQLQVRTNVDMLRTLEHIPEYLQPTVSYDSVKLCHSSVLLDSRNREQSSTNYTWYLTNNIGNIQRGQVNSRQIITQIVEIRCSPIVIPVTPLQNMQYYKNVRLGISEFANEGIEITTNNEYTKRNFFHFNFKSVYDSGYLYLYPTSTWRPRYPIAQCDQLTLNFFGSKEAITLQPDNMYCSYVAGATTTFTSPQIHNLATGDLIYIESGELLNDQGYYVVVTSLYSFYILKNSTSNATVLVHFASKDIQVQLDFVCLE